jgi:hypothetical protein
MGHQRRQAAGTASDLGSDRRPREQIPACLLPPRPLSRILPTIERPILDVIKFVAPGRRKIAPSPQRPLWRQSLRELETRALALQRD